MKKYIKYSFILFLSWFIIHSLIITIDGLNDNYIKADVALILGNTVKENGELSDRLKARVDKGLNLYQKQVVKKIIVSGGLGKEGFYEGDEMKKYLVLKGVNEKDIIVDNQGNTTLLSAFNYLKIQKEFNLKSVVVVSQYFHISRIRLMLKELGCANVYSAPAEYWEIRDVYSVFREFFAYYQYLLFKK
jgi:vancomycin permeability regulator SanA